MINSLVSGWIIIFCTAGKIISHANVEIFREFTLLRERERKEREREKKKREREKQREREKRER